LNTDLGSGDKEKNLIADVLVTYMVNPGTALYVGYTDNYQNMALDPSAPNGWRRTQNPTLNTGSALKKLQTRGPEKPGEDSPARECGEVAEEVANPRPGKAGRR
jgi:hypothetical protein